jgi:hypothetical protein
VLGYQSARPTAARLPCLEPPPNVLRSEHVLPLDMRVGFAEVVAQMMGDSVLWSTHYRYLFLFHLRRWKSVEKKSRAGANSYGLSYSLCAIFTRVSSFRFAPRTYNVPLLI